MTASATRALLGALWFEFWFFAAFPAGLLYVSGANLVPDAGLHWIPGVVLLAGAHALLLATVVAFVQRGGTHLPFDPPSVLISNGLYGRIRNPMYSAYIAIAIGEAVVYRSAALAGYAVGFCLLIHLYLTRIEEPGLRARFGETYESYCRSTGRWLPRRSSAPELAGRGPG